MLAVLDPGLVRELQAILTLFIGPLLSGFSMGFSAVAVPDMKEEMRLVTAQSPQHDRLHVPGVIIPTLLSQSSRLPKSSSLGLVSFKSLNSKY